MNPTPRFTSGDVDAVLNCFAAQQIRPRPLSALYRLAIVLVTFAMLMLPLLYVGVIVAVAWLEIWYAGAGTHFFDGVGARTVVLLYLGPLFAGAMLALFMVKPLFSRTPKPKPPVFVTREEQPALWALVEKLCAIMRAPAPRTIALDCNANASAAFEPGLFAFLTGRLRLTVGMPLVTGMTLEQLTGVLAHEFGHFAQGGGMRLSGTIRRVNAWFARVVYERDGFDRFLGQMANTGLAITVLPAAIAMGGVWLVRKLLWVFMSVGHMLSANLMRQMEFDADSFEVRVAGAESFVTAMRRVVELSAANEHAWDIANESYRNGKLAEDIPMLTANSAMRLPARVRAAIDSNLAQEKGGMFDTHPVPSARCAAARAMGDAGIFKAPFPATMLFRDGAALSREITRHHYTVINEISSEKLPLVPNEEIEIHDRVRMLNGETLDEAFGGLFIVEIPVAFAELKTSDAGVNADMQACAGRVRAASEKMNAAAVTVGDALAKLKKADEAHLAQAIAATLMFIECKGAARQVAGATKLASGSKALMEANRRADVFQAEMDALAHYGEPVSELLHATVAARLATAADDKAREEVLLRWEILKTVRKHARAWLRMRENAASLSAAINALATSSNPGEAVEGLYRMSDLADLIAALDDFQQFRCPFADAPEGGTMRDFLTTYISQDAHELVNRQRCLNYFVTRFDEAHTRISGWLMRDDTENTQRARDVQARSLAWPS